MLQEIGGNSNILVVSNVSHPKMSNAIFQPGKALMAEKWYWKANTQTQFLWSYLNILKKDFKKNVNQLCYQTVFTLPFMAGRYGQKILIEVFSNPLSLFNIYLNIN